MDVEHGRPLWVHPLTELSSAWRIGTLLFFTDFTDADCADATDTISRKPASPRLPRSPILQAKVQNLILSTT